MSFLRPTGTSGRTSKLLEQPGNTHLCGLREGLKAVTCMSEFSAVHVFSNALEKWAFRLSGCVYSMAV